jgi:hypothetical protein
MVSKRQEKMALNVALATINIKSIIIIVRSTKLWFRILFFQIFWYLSFFSLNLQGDVGDPGIPGEPGPKGFRGLTVSGHDSRNNQCFFSDCGFQMDYWCVPMISEMPLASYMTYDMPLQGLYFCNIRIELSDT